MTNAIINQQSSTVIDKADLPVNSSIIIQEAETIAANMLLRVKGHISHVKAIELTTKAIAIKADPNKDRVTKLALQILASDYSALLLEQLKQDPKVIEAVRINGRNEKYNLLGYMES